MANPVVVEPDAEGFVPNGWIYDCPGYYSDSGPCAAACCEPDFYEQPYVWRCQKGCGAHLRHPGECVNCTPPRNPIT